MKFSVKALRGATDVVRLTVEADDIDEARRTTSAQGLSILSVKARYPIPSWLLRPRAAFALELFIQQFVSLLESGLSLVEAIDLLAEKEQGRGAVAALNELRADLHRGRNFSDALARQPALFPPLLVATVRASERTGDIKEAVTRYLDYRTQLEAIRRKVVSAAIYPALLLMVGALVTAFMMFYVVPKFSRIYDEIGGNLPLLTRLMIGWGQMLEAHAASTLLGLVAAIGLAVFVSTRAGVRRRVAAMLWRLPAIGSRLRIYELARFYQTLGMLLNSGIPLPASLDMAGSLLSPALRTGLQGAAREIREGQSVSEAFFRHGLTTQVAMRLLTVGERSGRLPHLVERIALFYKDELARWIDWFTRLFEPALMVLIAALVGLIVVLLYLPIFELAESIR